MKYPNIDSKELIALIKKITKQELLPRFNQVSHALKEDGSIVTEADIVMQNTITQALEKRWPEFVVLGEEMTTEQQSDLLSSGKAVWCLDPLDGTSNFALGIPYFAVSLCLIYQDDVVLGLVYDPIRDECFFAQKNPDDTFEIILGMGIAGQEKNLSLIRATAIVDFKRLSNDLATRIVVERPFSSQRNFGASALDWCWLTVGRGQVYLHGNQNIWDYGAGEFIFRVSGGFSSTFDGEPVFKKVVEKRSVVAAINQSLFNEWTKWLNMPNRFEQ